MKLTKIFLLVAVVFAVAEAGRFTGLYNQRVIKAEKWERPLMSGGSSGYHGSWPWQFVAMALRLRHEGVVVTLQNGSRWLVQKGDKYGNASQTVVLRASYMSRKWKKVQSKRVSRSRLGDYVRAGGKYYSLWRDNCQHAAKRMMRLP